MDGLHIVFEGSDGSGKTTMSKAVYDHFRPEFGDKIIHTRHPGETLLGKELREIIKHREDIELDPLTERILFLADNSAFCFTKLIPALKQGKIVLSDRSNFISDYAYGPPFGFTEEEIKQPHSVIMGAVPKMSLLLIYDIPWDVAKQRMSGDIVDGEQKKCRIEQRGDKYFHKVIARYRIMGTGLDYALRDYVDYENIKHIDATQPLTKVMEETIEHATKLIEGRSDTQQE